MAFQNATRPNIQNSTFYDIGGHQIHYGGQLSIGPIVQISNSGTTHSQVGSLAFCKAVDSR
jgi:hypothetical protein